MSKSNRSWPVYNPQAIEPKWQQLWEQDGLYLAHESSDRPKFYCLDFFPYPSGDGLHVGHCRNYIPTDVTARFKRMQGYNVLHPMGWDAFGEPAEQYAMAHNIHPRHTTDRNTANFRRQMTIIGAGYDWSREIDSSDPRFYQWTQRFFLLLYQRGLAYRDYNFQWWCPTCKTTLSSHEAAGGVCWRGHTGVTKRKVPAWFFKITAYADQLLEGLDVIDWPDPIKTIQRNWIGRSEGVKIDFVIYEGPAQKIPVFTTRPDTIYGVTFFLLAPEHPLVEVLTVPAQRAQVEAYIAQAIRRTDVERISEVPQKTGVFTGGYVINPVNNERIPVWIADYVLPGYGTGAVMGVPAHDQRDYQFARQFGLPVRIVISPGQENFTLEAAYTGDGALVSSGPFDGLPNQQGIQAISDYIQQQDWGRRAVNYRMRDWLISRQHYWGTPIPIVYCEACGEVPLPEDRLPVLLPYMEDFQPDGSGLSPLARLPDFVHTTCPNCAGPARRETDTMGGFACSSWYFLRFTSPHDDQGPFEPEAMRYWMPVDLYVGGAEHAVLHLLYARFWTHVMADAGLLPFREPFLTLRNQGQLLAPDGQRMSKSRGNVITPDSMVELYGADALRIYEMFMAPFDQDIQWSADGLIGARRFLNRVWNLYAEAYGRSAGTVETDPELVTSLHKTIGVVTERIAGFRFNTMISALMEFTNVLLERFQSGSWHTATFHQSLETLMVLLAPAVPHLAEELWQQTGHAGSVHQQPWPGWEAELAQDQFVQIAVQVDGKVREVIQIPRQASEAEVRELAFAQPKISQRLEGKLVKGVFYAPGRVLNIVTTK